MSIKKIAEITGTSPATVSRVLNNPSYKCAVPGLRDKIWRAAMDFFYPEYVIETYQTEKEGFQTMQKFLKLKEPPTGIYCANRHVKMPEPVQQHFIPPFDYFL